MKRCIAILLSVVLIISLLVGCSDKSKNNQENKDISFNQKLTVDYHYKNIGESTIASYERLCNAVLSYDSSCKINFSDIDNISLLFYTSFPLHILVDSLDRNDNGTEIIISYKLSQQEHLKKIKQFDDAIEELRNECGYGTVSKDVYLLNAYSYICQNFTIDDKTVSVVDTAVTKKGIASSLSGLFEYLLLLENIPACHIIKMANNSPSAMFSCAMLKGSFYLFDVSEEINKTSGKGLKFFAMSSKRAVKDKSTLCYTDNTELEELDDEAFNELKSCTSFELDGKILKAEINDKGTKEFELS